MKQRSWQQYPGVVLVVLLGILLGCSLEPPCRLTGRQRGRGLFGPH